MVKTKKTSLVNKDYCKRYRESNKKGYRKQDRERKVRARNSLNHLEPEKYKCKMKEEGDRLKLYRLRKKLATRAAEKEKPSKPVDEENPTRA